MRETCTGARKNELAGISSNHCSTKIISWHAGDAAEYLASENHHIFKKTLHSDSKANRTTKTFCDTCSRRLLHDPDLFNSLDPIDLIMRSNQISLSANVIPDVQRAPKLTLSYILMKQLDLTCLHPQASWPPFWFFPEVLDNPRYFKTRPSLSKLNENRTRSDAQQNASH